MKFAHCLNRLQTNSINKLMTKKEAIAMFSDEWNQYVKFRAPEYADDICAKRQGFVDFIDTLHRDGEITDKQVNSWSNPF